MRIKHPKVLPWSMTLLLVITGCQISNLGGAPGRRYDARTFYETVSMRGASFSADGTRLLFTSDASGIYNAYALDLATGEQEQLTQSTTDAVASVSWFPDDDRCLVAADQAGNELTHIYVRELNGSLTDLTPGDDLKASFAGWSDDELSFFVLTNERDARYFDVYRYAVGQPGDRPGRELLFENTGGYQVGEVGADGRKVALTLVRTNVDNDLYLWRTDQPDEPVHVTPHEGDVTHGVQAFSPDGDTLYYTSDAGDEFYRVWAYDIESGESQVALDEDWDVSFYAFSRDGRFRITGINADARTRVEVFDLGTQRAVDLPAMPSGEVIGVSIEPEGTRMAFYVNGDTSPSNLFMLDMETGRHEQLTTSLSPAIDERDLVAAKVVRYESFDGLDIPALLYRPRGASPQNRSPALVWVHGGPGGQSRTGYRASIQHLVNHGYTVLAVNNRGSSGYGRTFFHMDDQRHGDVDLKDCIWGRRYLEELPWVDPGSVGIIGGSYGGYMVAAALAFEPEAFDVGIDIFGVTNWLRTLESIPPWWEGFKDSLYAEMGDPATDRERLHGNSPLFHAQNIRRPLLVVQGANDPRVLQVESDELVAAVRANGVPVEYVVFEDEGHGFRNRENRIEASETYLAFLEMYLRGSNEVME